MVNRQKISIQRRGVLCVAFGSLFACLARVSHSAIATSAFQWTQLGQLEAQVLKQMETLSTVVNQFTVLKNSFDLTKLAGEMGLPVELFRSVQSLQSEISNLRNFYQSVTRLQGKVETASQFWNQRFSLAQRNGVTYEQQVQMDAQAYKSKNARAIMRLEQEKTIYAAVEEDYKRAQEWGNKITGTAGIHESMGLANVQMNQILQQNARVVHLLAQAQGYDKAEQESAEAAKKMKDLKIQTDMMNREAIRQQKMQEALKSFGS